MLLALGALVGLVLFLAGGALVLLSTDPGEARVRKLLVEQANAALKGRLEVGDVGLNLSTGRLRLTDLKLYDPEGELVAEVAQLEANLRLRSLTRKQVVLTHVTVTDPHLFLVSDADGLNLARALEPREEKPEDTGPGTLVLEVQDFQLRGGLVDFRDQTPVPPGPAGTAARKGPEHARLEALEATGTATWQAATRKFEARLGANAHLAAPLQGPVQLGLTARGEHGGAQADARLEGPGLLLEVQGGLEPAGDVSARKLHLVLAPATARTVLPTWPLQVPLDASATLQRTGDVVSADVQAAAGGARLTAKARANTATRRVEALSAEARGVDLEELLQDGPPTSLDADLRAHGSGTSLDDLDGAVSLQVRPSRFRGQAVGPVELEARAGGGRYALERLRVLLPGASLEAQGGGTRQHVDVQGSLTAVDLQTLSRTLNALAPGAAPALAGSGALTFRVTGPVRAPGVQAQGGFPLLVAGATRVRGLRLKADVPDLRRPLDADATLYAASLTTGGQTLEDVSASLATQGRDLRARVRVQGATQVALDLDGTLDADGQGLDLARAALTAPGARWEMQGRSRLEFGERLRLAPTTLTSGEQRVLAEADVQGERVRARLEVDALDLAGLPRLLVPEALGLGGRATARISVDGRLPRPDATLSLQLAGVQTKQVQGVDAQLEARYVRDRARGTLAVRAPVGRLRGAFDLPVTALLERRREPLEAELVLEELRVEEALRLAGSATQGAGLVDGRLTVGGLARDPRLHLVVRGRELSFPQHVPPDVTRALAFDLTLSSAGPRGALQARLDVGGLGREVWAALETPWTVGALREKPPTQAVALATPVRLELRALELPLALLGKRPGYEGTEGCVSLTASFAGPLRASQGRAELQLAGVRWRGQPPLDGRAELVTTERDVQLGADVTRAGAPFLTLRSRLGAPPASLYADAAALERAPLTVHARLGPVRLPELTALAAPQDPTATRLAGDLVVRLEGRGTAAAPEATLTADVTGLGVEKLALGEAHARWTYARARHALEARLLAPGGGSLRAEGSLALDVSLPAVRRGRLARTAREAPLDLRIVSERFDLAFLSGGIPTVRQLGGRLEADARVQGAVGAPTLEGRVEWVDGRLQLEGLGDYREAHLKLEVSPKRVVLSDLRAKAGRGSLELKGEADRPDPGGPYRMRGEGRADDFPVIFEDQLVATLSLRTQFTGELGERLVYFRDVRVPEAHVVLPESDPKELQQLEKAEDIVLVRGGVPLDRKKRAEWAAREKARKAALAQQQQAAAGGAASGGAGGAPGAEGGPPPRGPGSGNEGASEAGARRPQPPEEDAELAAEAEADEEEDVPAPLRQYWANVNAPRNVWVRGPDLNVELGLSKDFRVEYTDRTALTGIVYVLRGRVEVLGRRFDAQRDSRVQFSGPPLQPALDVSAVHVNEREDVTVTVTLRGQGRDLKIIPTSEPPLAETEIYTLLATGRRTLRPGSGQSTTGTAQAASVLGSVLAGQAKKALANKLPIDVVSIETGGAENPYGVRLELGTYVSDKIYVGYTRQMASDPDVAGRQENLNEVQFEYQLSPSWSLEAEYGDAYNGSVDLIWRRDY